MRKATSKRKRFSPLGWWTAFWEMILMEQPFDLPAKPEPSQIVNEKTKLKYAK